jgi:hypothetical protein
VFALHVSFALEISKNWAIKSSETDVLRKGRQLRAINATDPYCGPPGFGD